MERLCVVYIATLIAAIAAESSPGTFPHIKFPCAWHGKTFDGYTDGVFQFTMSFDSAGDFFYITNNQYELVNTVGSFMILRRNDSRVFCSKVDDIQSGDDIFYFRNGFSYAGSLLKPEKIDDMPHICKICRVNSNQGVFQCIEQGSGIIPTTTYNKDFCDTPVGCNLIGKGDLDSIGCTDNGSLDFANNC